MILKVGLTCGQFNPQNEKQEKAICNFFSEASVFDISGVEYNLNLKIKTNKNLLFELGILCILLLSVSGCCLLAMWLGLSASYVLFLLQRRRGENQPLLNHNHIPVR